MNGNLELAKNNIVMCRRLLTPYDEDCLMGACFHIEQAIELCMKFMAVRKGISIGKKHDIAVAVKLLRDKGYDLSPWLNEHAVKLKSWAIDSRYNLNVKLELNTATAGLQEASQLLQYCLKLDSQDESIQRTNAFGGL